MLAVFSVSNLDDTGAGSLRDAIDQANLSPGADEINFSVTGTINIASQLPTIVEGVTITGPGAELLTIDAGDGTDGTFGTGDGWRVFEINDGHAANQINVVIEGLTLTGGDQAGNGGAVSNEDDLTIAECMIRNNKAGQYGGGIFNNHNNQAGNTVNFVDCTIQANVASYGGGIYSQGGASTNINITATAISSNTADKGGGIISGYRSTTAITSSAISGNSASGNGGGIYNYGTTTVANSTISGNSASGYGGGIFNVGASSTTTITSSTINGNSAVAGGGIANSYGTTLVANCTMSGNFASLKGGGMFNGLGGAATISSSTITDDSETQGGGIRNDATLELSNTIVAVIGDDIILGLDGTATGSYNLIEDGSGGLGLTNTIIGDPLLGPLADNGGPTPTHVLLPGSPAINAGDPGFSPPSDFDQRGVGFDRISGGRIDMGAFEVQAPASGDFDNDGDVDGRDFLAWQRGGSPSPLSSEDLELWQEEYGTSQLSVVSAQLLGDESASSLGGSLAVSRAHEDACDHATAFVDAYVEEVDRALD